MKFGYHRDFMRMPLSEAPRWVLCCLFVVLALIILMASHIVPERFDTVLGILTFMSGGAAACYIAFWKLNQIMKTGTDDGGDTS